MNRIAHKYLLLWLFSWFLVSCIADPWPEPDDANRDNDEVGGDTPQYPGDTNWSPDKSGGDGDVDNGEEFDADTEGPLTPDDDVDAGDLGDGGDGGFVEDLIFISTPMDGGPATVVGLAGAVPSDSTLIARSGELGMVIPVGREGGFAARIPSAYGWEDLELLLAYDIEHFSSVPVIVGTMDDLYTGSIIGDGAGAYRLSESLATVSGEGNHLDGYLVVAANLTGSVGALAPVTCYEQRCMFSLVIPAASGDKIDLFLVPESANRDVDYIRAGTTTETIIVK